MSTVFFSIASSRQLANAKVLLDSIKNNYPESETFLVLAERRVVAEEVAATGKFGHQIVSIDQLEIDDLERFAFQYDADEFHGALKPWSLDYFLKRFESVIYFDPDIELFSKPVEILKYLSEYEAVVTPCATFPLPDDGLFPSNIGLMRAGQFHSGFFAIRSSREAREFARYWKDETHRGLATIDPFDSWMGNQLLFSGITSFIGPVMVIRRQDHHFSIWNSSQRQLSLIDGRLTTSDGPLVFINFQGLTQRREKIFGQPQWARQRFLPSIEPVRDTLSSSVMDQALKTHESKVLEAQNKLQPYSKHYSFGNYLNAENIFDNDRRIYLHVSSIEKRDIGNPFQAKEKIRKRELTISRQTNRKFLDEIESMKKGLSWKIGRTLTWPLRAARKLVKTAAHLLRYFFVVVRR